METVQSSWYVADLLMEIKIAGATRNVLHRNLFLIAATNADEAYQKAIQLGSRSEQSYKNPHGQQVDHKFRGVAKLDNIVDGTLEDGAELAFSEYLGVPEDQIRRWICPKDKLGAFSRFDPSRKLDPDYRSGEVMDQLAEALGDPNPEVSSPMTCFTVCPGTSFTVLVRDGTGKTNVRPRSNVGCSDPVSGPGSDSNTPTPVVPRVPAAPILHAKPD